ncbi:hypothetical protein [Acinetobacter johnsonii]|uniref:hypothetical protein n=1 Tax=Acinetobacter johnsonii TaxID=40214 RepID=UPI0011E7826A|nr:hypothetical protein [Acinetobacter johnsonii]QEK35991.1 hypothetical protein FYN22_09015 [Acinetobacter johnsonii]
MKKISTFIAAGLFTMLSATAFACPQGTTLSGGTGANHKGGKCVATMNVAKHDQAMKQDKTAKHDPAIKQDKMAKHDQAMKQDKMVKHDSMKANDMTHKSHKDAHAPSPNTPKAQPDTHKVVKTS